MLRRINLILASLPMPFTPFLTDILPPEKISRSLPIAFFLPPSLYFLYLGILEKFFFSFFLFIFLYGVSGYRRGFGWGYPLTCKMSIHLSSCPFSVFISLIKAFYNIGNHHTLFPYTHTTEPDTTHHTKPLHTSTSPLCDAIFQGGGNARVARKVVDRPCVLRC